MSDIQRLNTAGGLVGGESPASIPVVAPTPTSEATARLDAAKDADKRKIVDETRAQWINFDEAMKYSKNILATRQPEVQKINSRLEKFKNQSFAKAVTEAFSNPTVENVRKLQHIIVDSGAADKKGIYGRFNTPDGMLGPKTLAGVAEYIKIHIEARQSIKTIPTRLQRSTDYTYPWLDRDNWSAVSTQSNLVVNEIAKWQSTDNKSATKRSDSILPGTVSSEPKAAQVSQSSTPALSQEDLERASREFGIPISTIQPPEVPSNQTQLFSETAAESGK